MGLSKIILACLIASGLGACGNTLPDQALLGAAIGTGAAVVTSGSIVQGAAIGAGGNVLACQAKLVRCR